RIRPLRTIRGRRARADAIQATAAFDECGAKLRMVCVRVGGRDDILRLVTVTREHRRLQWKRLSERTVFTGHVADGNLPLLYAEYGFPGDTIQNVHVRVLRHSDESR